MPINKAALDKLKGATFTPYTFVDAMRQMCEFSDMVGSGDSQMTLDYQVKGEGVEPGDKIPFITFGLRQADVSEVAE
jgi:hypothetical protein